MGLDPISIGMAGLSGYQAFQQYEAGKEAQEAYNASAAEIGRQTAYAQRMALEEMKDVRRQGQAAQGRVKAGAGKAGVRVAGSVVTLTESIERDIERKKSLIGMEFSEQARRNAFEIDRLRAAGRSVRKAAGIEAFGSLLTGGLMLAKRKEGLGKDTTWWDLFSQRSRTNKAKRREQIFTKPQYSYGPSGSYG